MWKSSGLQITVSHHNNWNRCYILIWIPCIVMTWYLLNYRLHWDGVRSGIFYVNLRRLMNTYSVHLPFHSPRHDWLHTQKHFPFTSSSLPGLVQVIQGKKKNLLHRTTAYFSAKQNANNVLHHSVPKIITLCRSLFFRERFHHFRICSFLATCSAKKAMLRVFWGHNEAYRFSPDKFNLCCPQNFI